MSVENLRNENKLLDLFCTLVEIPSPSGKEDKVAAKIKEILNNAGIEAKEDSFKNVIAHVKATDSSKKPIILSAHMDVIGDNSPVNINYDGKFFETDKIGRAHV